MYHNDLVNNYCLQNEGFLQLFVGGGGGGVQVCAKILCIIIMATYTHSKPILGNGKMVHAIPQLKSMNYS